MNEAPVRGPKRWWGNREVLSDFENEIMSGRVAKDDAAFVQYVETAKKTPVEQQNECQKIALSRSYSMPIKNRAPKPATQ